MIKMKVRKAIIPAAGLGTRFLPATKSIPKEMLPIVDIPTIQYIVQEAVDAGIEEILIIVSGSKTSVENHFDVNFDLETRLLASNKTAEAQQIRAIADMADVFFVRQKEPKGLGHAILCAKAFVGEEPFAVLLGDDVVINDEKPALKQLIDAYEKTGSSILGVQYVADSKVNKYGVVKIEKQLNDDLFKINGMIEKPSLDKAPSNFAVLGRYVLTSRIFDILAQTKPGKGNEIQLTDGIVSLLEHEDVYAYNFEGIRYDVGDKFGYIKAQIDFSLRRDDLRMEVMNYIKEIVK
ncbi:MAG: UTP--glucose-1-phosphate uridylyltransferase GalU [Bacilli bacterium]|jgi:UTP--glucose-1-phosphate uridylyltransferase|nr:UTP--glucose-1-phosphate uridylyltransferase GalU [Bacilli bacterium]